MIVGWLALALASAPGADLRTVRGMTVSCPTWGWEWGSDAMAESLTVLDDLGVNWVSIHPYARVHPDGSLTWKPIDADPPAWLTRPVAEAHARGQGILIKPHIAYWGSGFAWRGDIAFTEPAARARFFADYQRWVRELAAAVPEADAFAVGTELDRTARHESEWRAVIASVREVFPGHLTYAANWDGFENIPFWDALDAVGVQAYFPLASEEHPVPLSDAELDLAWEPWLVRLRAVSQRTGKPVVFTELGYDRALTAAVEPWRSGGGGDGAAVQEACLRAGMRAIEREPTIVGAFLWKWFPGEVQHGDYRMSEPRLRSLILDAWGSVQEGQPVVGSAAGGP